MIFEHNGTRWSLQIKSGRYYWIETTAERNPKTGRLKQRCHTLTKVSEGLSALATRLDALSAKPNRPQGDMPGLITTYLKVKLHDLRSPYVQKEYRRIYERIAKEFAAFNVADVRPTDVLDLLSLFAGHARTRQAYKSRLSSFFSWCVIGERISRNPCAEVRVKHPAKKKMRFTPERFHAMREAMPELGQCMLDMMFLTMQRPHDIRLLKESQIEAGFIHFLPSKTEASSGEHVSVPVTPEISAVLVRARKIQKVRRVGTGDAFVFQTGSGTPYSKTGFNSMWKRARAEAKLQATQVNSTDVRPYAMKCAEAMGYNLNEIQTNAAHALATTTAGYLSQYNTPVSVVRLSLPPKPGSA